MRYKIIIDLKKHIDNEHLLNLLMSAFPYEEFLELLELVITPTTKLTWNDFNFLTKK